MKDVECATKTERLAFVQDEDDPETWYIVYVGEKMSVSVNISDAIIQQLRKKIKEDQRRSKKIRSCRNDRLYENDRAGIVRLAARL